MTRYLARMVRRGLRKAARATLADGWGALLERQSERDAERMATLIRAHCTDAITATLHALSQKASDEARTVNKGIQILLALKYQEMLRRGEPLPGFDAVEFRCFSQNTEDGILWYLFSLLGATNKKVVEICAWDGTECNAANLIINHGWDGLLFDGDAESIRRGTLYYRNLRDTCIWPPKLVHAWITRENVNSLISDHGFDGDIDLLSLDLDGNDYWIWQSITGIRPRVVVLEYQSILGPDRSVTIPYQEAFKAEQLEYGPDYAGASLSALVKLGREKGYRLVGCQSYGFNAFFLRSDVGRELFPEISPRECFRHPKLKFDVEQRYPKVASREWVEV